MSSFERQRLEVAGIETTLLTAGQGAPVVVLHDIADTLVGLDYTLPLAERSRLLVPYHPGFGESADDPAIHSIHDYVMHYLALFDALDLERFSLVGQGLGGWIAVAFAIEHAERVDRLVLAAPFGLRVPEHPSVDVFRFEVDDLLALQGLQVGGPSEGPDPTFRTERYRELTSLARVMWERNYDLRLPRWMHRARMPTLLLWGGRDRLIPVEQAATWSRLLPNAELRVFDEAGHLVLYEAPAALSAVAGFVSD